MYLNLLRGFKLFILLVMVRSPQKYIRYITSISNKAFSYIIYFNEIVGKSKIYSRYFLALINKEFRFFFLAILSIFFKNIFHLVFRCTENCLLREYNKERREIA